MTLHQIPVGAFIEIDIEVVEPEIGQHLIELPVAVDGTEQLTFRQVARYHQRQ